MACERNFKKSNKNVYTHRIKKSLSLLKFHNFITFNVTIQLKKEEGAKTTLRNIYCIFIFQFVFKEVQKYRADKS